MTTAEKMTQIRQANLEDRVALLRGTKSERTFTVEREGVDEEARTAWMSISSEAPYERYWGTEILDHKPKSIRAGRMNNGAALLVGHDSADQVGVVERFEITSDKKMRILARFSRSARAEEIFRDVIDGIRRNTSVGYMIHDLALESKNGDQATYRVTDWEPYEGSIVSIPADPTVGVGREMADEAAETIQQFEGETMSDVIPEVKAAPVVDTAAIQAQAQSREMQRQNDLQAWGETYKEFGGVEFARALARDPNGNLDMLRAKVLEKMATVKALPLAEPAPVQNQRIETHFRHSPLKAFKDLPIQGGGVMKAEEAAYRAGQWLLASVYGSEKSAKWCREHGMETRVMHGGALTAGGALVPVEMETAIIDLRDTYGVARRLAKMRPMTSDSVRIPRKDGGLTPYFFSDSDGTGITASDKTWGEVRLNVKKLGVLAKLGRDLEEDAVINAVDDLSMEMAWAFSQKEDQCWVDGDGTSTYGGMTGMRTKLAATAYLGRVAATTNHNLMSEVDATDLSLVMAGVASYAKPGAAWVCSETFKSMVFDRLAMAAGGNTTITTASGPVAAYSGYPIITSEAMPAGGATDYLNAIMCTFGRHDMASSFGSRRGIEIQVLQERYAELGQIGIIATERIDIVVHDLGSTTVKGPIAGLYGA